MASGENTPVQGLQQAIPDTQPIIDALDALGAQIRRMEQRMPSVHFELGLLWAKDKEARAVVKAIREVGEA